MATRSLIGIQFDNYIKYIYCHYDGYPDNQLPLLNDYYSNLTDAEALISLGDISYLAEYVESDDPDSLHSFDTPEDGVVVAYGRDRGEPWSQVKPKLVADLESYILAGYNCGAEYLYLFDPSNSEWQYCDLHSRGHLTWNY